MKFAIPLFVGLLILTTSCKSQNSDWKVETGNYDETLIDNTIRLGNNIMVVYQDKKNNYWFGSWVDGLFRYDGKNMDHFTTRDGLSHNRIDEIKEDASGKIYFNTSAGVCFYDGLQIVPIKIASGVNPGWQLKKGDLWFRNMQAPGKVYRFDGKYLYPLEIPKNQPAEDFAAKNPGMLSPYDVYWIYADRKENLWFGTASAGALRFDGTSFDWITESDVTEFHYGPSNGVRSILEDKDGYFWFNSMYHYNIYNAPQLETGNHFSRTFYIREDGPGNLDGQSDSDLHEYLSITKDNQDNVWIATYADGVWKYDGITFTHYAVQDDGKDIRVFSIYKDNKGDLWLGTQENGVFRFDGKKFTRLRL